jgi:hypothetical protein
MDSFFTMGDRIFFGIIFIAGILGVYGLFKRAQKVYRKGTIKDGINNTIDSALLFIFGAIILTILCMIYMEYRKYL